MGLRLTLMTEEALKHKVADFRAETIERALDQLDLAGAQVRRVSPNWAEDLVRFLKNPIVSSLLMTIGTLGLLLEIRTPGFGIPGALGITSPTLVAETLATTMKGRRYSVFVCCKKPVNCRKVRL